MAVQQRCDCGRYLEQGAVDIRDINCSDIDQCDLEAQNIARMCWPGLDTAQVSRAAKGAEQRWVGRRDHSCPTAPLTGAAHARGVRWVIERAGSVHMHI